MKSMNSHFNISHRSYNRYDRAIVNHDVTIYTPINHKIRGSMHRIIDIHFMFSFFVKMAKS